MNNKHFFLTLSATNIKKNGKFYLPYLATYVMTVAIYYIMAALVLNKDITHIQGADSTKTILVMGRQIIAIFSVIFLFYSNSFLIKRRKKEFGLYSILGMEKRHIAKVLFGESLMISLAGIVGGVVTGIVFHKLAMMILLKIMGMEIILKFSIETGAIMNTLIVFLGIFVLTFLYNEIVMLRTKTIDLLKSEKMGEREPKTKWLTAIIGVACVGVGYYIAITTKKPLQALDHFFIAVLLVIIGTHCLFSAGSIAWLKMLRKNKKYYYQTKHFTAVSGMIYRMKQNAAGLATICILSTMVLVMMSTTVCLYMGAEDALNTRYPYSFYLEKKATDDFNAEKFTKKVTDTIESKCKIEEICAYHTISLSCLMKNGQFDFSQDGYSYTDNDFCLISLFTLEDYNRITGEHKTLEDGETLVFYSETKIPKEYDIYGINFQVKEYLKAFMGLEASSFEEKVGENRQYIVVKDLETMRAVIQKEMEVYTQEGGTVYDTDMEVSFEIGVQVKEDAKAELAVYDKLQKIKNVYLESKEYNRQIFCIMYGDLLFLGAFLGIAFIMATALIIYYKQISEGYDDKERFEIMQKVGMSKKEVKGSIRSQVIMVFFLPLITAVIHVSAAFPLIEKLLILLNLSNTDLFIWCVMVTVAVFAVVYGIIYSLTSKVYYKIVE